MKPELTFDEAVDGAIADALETGRRQSVYRHGLVGWTWTEVG